MAALTLAELGRLAKVIVDRQSVNPGDVVIAQLLAPLPQDSVVLNNAGYNIDVSWRVTAVDPAPNADGTTVNNAAPAALDTDYIAPTGLHQLSAAFVLRPPYAAGAAPPARRYWVVARVTITWTTDITAAGGLGPLVPAGAVEQIVIEKASPPIDAVGLSGNDLIGRVTNLFKVEIPTAPLEPGGAIAARLRPVGAEDTEWDVESASEIAPQFDLAAKVQLEPVFRPLDALVNGVVGVGNQIIGLGVRLVMPLVRVIGGVGDGLVKIADAVLPGNQGGRGSRLSGLSRIDDALIALLNRLKIPRTNVFRDLQMPIDANLVNRNFTKNLVPRSATPPLPGPRGLLPTLPTLENRLELFDTLPAPLTQIPLASTMSIPLALNGVQWDYWRDPGFANALPAAEVFELEHTAGRWFKRVLAFKPPVAADSTIYLRIRINYSVPNPAGGAAIAQVATLPPIPIRLLRFDPLAFVGQQLQLSLPVDQVQPGEALDVALLTGLPVASSSLTDFNISFPLGALPLQTLPVTATWDVLNAAGVPLNQGTDYAVSGLSSLAKSFVFVPSLKVIRNESVAFDIRYLRVRLATAAQPGVNVTVGPLPLPVVALGVPMFVALFKYHFFGERNADEKVQVYVPSYYATHAPGWVESWDVFRDRLDELQRRLGQMLAKARSLPQLPQDFSATLVQRLSLWRATFDYVANRADSGKLLPLSGKLWDDPQWAGKYLSSHPLHPDNNNFFAPKTIVVVNDAQTSLQFQGIDEDGDWYSEDLNVNSTAARPVCILYPSYFSNGYYLMNWIPSAWQSPWTENVNTSCFLAWAYHWESHLHLIHASFDQNPGVTEWFASPAAIWRD
jgi:hypothetical protein